MVLRKAMDIDLLIITIYGGLYAMYLIKLTYDMGHEFHHWMFGLISIAGTIPVAIIYYFFPKDYYLTVIIIGLIAGISSFVMDYHDYKTWLLKKHKNK